MQLKKGYKKIMFKNRKKGILATFGLIFCNILSGCSQTLPPQDDIDIALDSALTIGYTYVSTEEVNEREIIYNYKADDGIDFKVKSSIGDGDYGEVLFTKCDYPDRWLEQNHSVIEGAIDDNFECKYLGGYVNIYINGFDDLQLASELVYSILSSVEPMPINRENLGSKINYNRIQIQIWSETHIKSFDFLYHNEEMPALEFILTELERNFLDLIEIGHISADDNIDESVFDKYPKTSLSGLKVNGELFDDVYLVYNEEYDDYLINFNSYLDFGTQPDRNYNYTDKGSFAKIIESFGGAHKTGEWTAKWTIGSDIWESEAVTPDDSDAFLKITDFIVYKNGEKLELQTPELGAIFKLTLADLELMTGKIITVHRNKGYAELN